MTAMSELRITPWKCPFCVAGLIGTDERCHHCAGTGLTDDPCGDAERAPRPPGVMRTACADCAYRQGSPELENVGAQLPDAEPFYCHQGLPVSATGAYTPTAMFRGLPLGAMVCAGWWAMQTGEPRPEREFREVLIDPEKQWGLPHVLTGVELSDEQRKRLSQMADPSGFTTSDGLLLEEFRRRGEALDAEMHRRLLFGDEPLGDEQP